MVKVNSVLWYGILIPQVACIHDTGEEYWSDWIATIRSKDSALQAFQPPSIVEVGDDNRCGIAMWNACGSSGEIVTIPKDLTAYNEALAIVVLCHLQPLLPAESYREPTNDLIPAFRLGIE